MLEVKIDDFLYNYFLINKNMDYISVYDLNMIKLMVDRYQQSIYLDFCRDELTYEYLDFEYSVKNNIMKKKKSMLSYTDETIRDYIRIPDIVIYCIIQYTRHKKIKQIQNKIYKEKTP